MKRLLILFMMGLMTFGIRVSPINLEEMHAQEITITVTGAVEEPGPIVTHPYATVAEVLECVDLKDSADLSALNPETVLNNHDVLNIPEKKQPGEPERISINTADEETLTRLPGIGPAMAQKIVSYRTEHGLFQKREDLLHVKGIGRAKYEKLEDLITL